MEKRYKTFYKDETVAADSHIWRPPWACAAFPNERIAW